ncbi:uncharacterized protein LOC128456655 [Pleuronectes platessa]|uniref:uncharacterized protein LOC128456655 n=1 Tax=Pleuronectes platessa TaxID=8262 RepID=UPI00232A3E9B|nr:uncharacterized protein LOC128456655 [Pleuronectes platessa]
MKTQKQNQRNTEVQSTLLFPITPQGGNSVPPVVKHPVPLAPILSDRACAVILGRAQLVRAPKDRLCQTELHSPLTLRLESWKACTASEWVLRTLAKGYRLQFATMPPRFPGLVSSRAQGESARVLREEISALLNKRAIRIVPHSQGLAGFYSRYFLVPKKGGTSLRPIMDLRILNSYLRRYKFRMLTHSTLIRLIRPGDWFTSIDLKDAYFHIPIYPPHRKYLRFAFQDTVYEYLVLPFGLSLSPRVFVKCVDAAIAPLRERGIRVATYLDDWLLLARSEQEAAAHTSIVLTHLADLGFVVNREKSVLTPSQEIAFLGLTLNSLTYTARLSAERVHTFRSTLSHFAITRRVTYGLCLRLLGLMASTILVVRLGRLYMRDFQRWVASLRLDPVRHRRRSVTACASCALALLPWQRPSMLTAGVRMGAISARKVVTTDASLSGWGGLFEGRSANGMWSTDLKHAHINYLELMAVFLTLKHFLPFLRGHHVLVRTDNTTTVAYINRQGGLRSLQLHTLARRLILWGEEHLLSVRATHVPGIQNVGADLLSRGNPLYAEWKLHPAVVAQIWSHFGRATVDLFASRGNTQCPLFFSLHDQSAPLGLDAFAHEWPRVLLYAFPPLALIPPTLLRVRENRLSLILIAPHWPSMHWLAEVRQLLHGHPWPLPLRRDLLSQACGQIFHPHPERLALWAWPDLIDQKRAFSTVKVYLAAISACHVGFDGKPVGQHPLVCRFMKGARRLLPVSKTMSPSWDLTVVLGALSSHPFEPLDNVDMKTLSLKVALLLALATAKRVSDIHALSVHPACMRFTPGNLGVTLRPNPAFVPKVVKPCSPVELSAFQPPPYGSAEQQRLHMLCPVRALHTYVERTRSFRKGDQLFVSWAKPHWGKPVTKQRLSHWIVDAIALAYSSSGLQVPTGLRAHSTRGLTTSWALFKGVSIQDICAAASWSSPLTFARYYRLDVTSPGLTHAVLSVGSNVDLTFK